VEPQEDKREWLGIWRTFKNDPLQPVRDYFHQYVITGIGLFLEGYVVRSTGIGANIVSSSVRLLCLHGHSMQLTLCADLFDLQQRHAVQASVPPMLGQVHDLQ